VPVRALMLMTLLAGLSLAQTLTKAPQLLKNVEPVFPAELVDAGVGGTVTMEVDVGVDGLVENVRVVKSAGPAFDAAALSAVRQLVFTPAEVDGQPAAVRIEFSSQFVFRPPVPVEAAAATRTPVVNLAGTLKAAGTREPIGGALVTAAGLEATTDEQGHFELADVPPGEVEVRVVAGGFEAFTQRERVEPGERTVVTYALSSSTQMQTVVRDVRERREVAQVKLTASEVRLLPGSNNDAFRVVQNLPGIARSPFGTSALVVRGSKAWDSRVYVDEVQVPQLFHFAGLTATFNSASIERIGFQPGNFGADFGRSIGGLVQGEVRTPSKSGVHGYADLNVFDLSALAEAPVTKDWSVSAAGRFGLAQYTVPWALTTFFPNTLIGFSLAPQYWDYQLRAERRAPNSKNRFFVGVFGASDRWAFVSANPFFDGDVEGNQGAAGSAQLYHRLVVGLDQRLTERLSFVSRNSVGFDASEQSGGVSEIFFRAQQVPVQLRERFRFELPEVNVSLGFGLDALVTAVAFDAQQPPTFKANQLPDPYVTRRLIAQTERSVYIEPGLFVDATWSPSERLQVRGGLRFDGELGVMKQVWLNPRLQARWSPWPQVWLKAGAAMYQQPPDYRQGQLSPTFGNPGLRPEGAWHFMAGAEATLWSALELDVQGYYKWLFDQARQTLASGQGSDVSIPGAETRYSSKGYGRAWGLEVLARVRPTRWLMGWVAYSLSRFERDYYGGVAFAPGPLDQPHNLIAVASVALPWGLNFGVRLRFASGPLVTPFINSIFDTNANQYVPLPALPWSQRLPNFVQLDLRLDKRVVFDAFSLSVYLDVQNVTNAQNPEALIYNFNYTRSAYVMGIPVLPTAGLRGEW
jgi:TonB family protein